MLPLGYSFNLDGTMMYCTFASIFIAQTYHIEMSLGTQLAMLATLMITSKGVAGVPRASLVVIAATLGQFNIPEAGLLMIMGIDTFLDMGRCATNVIGNSLATSVVAKWEGELAPEHEMRLDDAVPPDAMPATRCAPDARRCSAGGRLALLAASCAGTARRRRMAGSARPSPTSRRTHTVRLGYREASPPFSFLDQANRPIGYSLELCQAIVDEIGVEVDDPALKIEYVPVTPETRIPALLNNKIDLECGSTTANAERRQRVAFSPLIFVAGTKLMVPKARRSRRITDLKGKTIVVTRGTTNEQAIQAADKKFALGLKIVTADDHEQSYRMLADGKADAFATDDILLYGLIARHKAQDKMKVVGDLLSYDPYGIMFRKGEPQLAAVVERAFRKLATNHDLRAALSQVVHAAPADRRAARHRHLPAARGELQGARHVARRQQLGRRAEQDAAGSAAGRL